MITIGCCFRALGKVSCTARFVFPIRIYRLSRLSNFWGPRLKYPFHVCYCAPFSMSRIYLDNAATSWPKPESVYLAVDQTQRNVGVSAARGGYSSSALAGKVIKQTRQSVGALIGADDASRVALTSGCTDSLSTAIFGFLKQGDHAITTAADHNSVVRPLIHLRDTGVIDLTIVDCNDEGLVNAQAVSDALTPQTTLRLWGTCRSISNQSVASFSPPPGIRGCLARWVRASCMFVLRSPIGLRHCGSAGLEASASIKGNRRQCQRC